MMFEVKIISHGRNPRGGIEAKEKALAELLNQGWEIKGHAGGDSNYSSFLSFVLVRKLNESKEVWTRVSESK